MAVSLPDVLQSQPPSTAAHPAPGSAGPLPEHPPRWHTDALLVAMAVIWGLNFSVLKYAVAFVPALAFNGVRIPTAALAQFAIARSLRLPSVDRGVAWRLVALGALGNGVYQALFIIGLSKSRVATAALLIAASPALIALVGRLHGSERFTPRQGVGILLQLIGCGSVALGAATASEGSDSFLGAALILSASLTWAFFAVLLRKYTAHVNTLQLGAYTMLGGAMVMLAIGLPLIVQVDWRSLPALVWLALAYASLGAMVAANLFYYRGLRVLGPTRTSMYGNLQPMVAMAVAWIALREQPTAVQVLGGSLILAGLLVARTAAEPAEA
jgi:drug/metabolite transporter (DMT)-like permease